MFDSATNRLMSVTNMVANITAEVDQNFLWYNSSNGKNKNSSQVNRVLYVLGGIPIINIGDYNCFNRHLEHTSSGQTALSHFL